MKHHIGSEISWGRLIGASVVAYVVAVASLTILFGNPLIERILFTEQAGQSDKVLSVWLEQLDPLSFGQFDQEGSS